MNDKKIRKNHDSNRQRNRQRSTQNQDFSFRYRPDSSTVDGILIAYLQEGNEVYSGKEMVLQASRMCWLPLAYKARAEAGVDISEEELYRIGLICCNALEQHLVYLRMVLGLPNKSTDVLPIPLSSMTNSQLLGTMVNLGTGNFNFNYSAGNVENTQFNQNITSKKPTQKIDSDDFIPGKGSFGDDMDDMFANL
jgi:hypothetical protein